MAAPGGDKIKVLIAVMIVVAILPAVLSIGGGTGSDVLHGITGENTSVSGPSEVPENVEVEATTGYAVNFDGDGYVDVPATTGLEDGAWTVCLSAQLDSTNERASYTAFAYDDASVLVEYDDGEFTAYYEDGGQDAIASQPVSGVTDRLVPVCTVFDDEQDELSVVVDGDESEPAQLSSDPVIRSVSNDWKGTIEEVRTFNETLDSTTLQAYADDPVQPLPETDQTARLMFDEGEGTETAIYRNDEHDTATIVGGTWGDGFDGPDLEEGVDYEIHEPFSLLILSGGYLDGSPVQYVSWDPTGLPFNFLQLLGVLIGIFLLVTLSREIQY